MGHELRPRSGVMSAAKDVAESLRTEFAYVRSDEVDGLKRALARAGWIEQAPAKLFFGHHAEAMQVAARLRSLAPGEALSIEFGDAPTKTKQIVVMPGEPIKFGYTSKEDEEASKDLVDRCARVLDCDVLRF